MWFRRCTALQGGLGRTTVWLLAALPVWVAQLSPLGSRLCDLCGLASLLPLCGLFSYQKVNLRGFKTRLPD